jgi:hypothetical protein
MCAPDLMTTAPTRSRRRNWRHAAAASLLLAAASTHADTLDSAALSALAGTFNIATYVGTPSGAMLTVVEAGPASMESSTLFGFEGLWLGSDNTGGSYSLSFDQPILSLTLSFIALSFEDPVAELLTSFVSDTATTVSFSSPDASLSFSAGVVTPLELDSRGSLTFTSTLPGGFLSLSFSHLQPDALNGFIINQVDFNVAAVPEPASALFWAGGLLCLYGWRRVSS